MLILVVSLVANKETEGRQARYFVLLLALFAASFFFDAVAWLLDGMPGTLQRSLCVGANFLTYSIDGLVALVFAFYIHACVFPYAKAPKRFQLILGGVAATYQLLILITQFTGSIYSIDSNNVYQLGPYYTIVPLYAVVLLFSIGVYIFYHRKTLGTKAAFVLSSYAFIPIVAALFQLLLPDFMLIHIMFFLSLIIIYVNYQAKRNSELKLEMTESQTAIMLSQIQPHFLYNTLGSIQELYTFNPEQADQAMRNFSQYLRGNMRSINQVKPVYFNEELQHVKLYLELEKMRFEDRLSVEYRISTSNFVLPTLSLQPLVENAVKHGVTQRTEGGTIIISTYEDERTYVVSVEDDGVGFDLEEAKFDGQVKVGIANVRKRLANSVGALLQIESEIGKGTVAKIVIPKEVF